MLQSIHDLKENQASMCLLMLEVANTTSHMFWLHYKLNYLPTDANLNINEIALTPHSGRRIMIPLKRFFVDKSETKNVILQSQLKQFVRSDKNLSPAEVLLANFLFLRNF